MMRRVFSVALTAALVCVFGLAPNANAGVTIDVVFQDATAPSGLLIPSGNPWGPGCVFTGYYGASVTSGHCMDVILKTTDPIIGMGVSVTYDSDNGLQLASMWEWKGVGLVFNKSGVPTKSCAPPGGIVDKGGIIQSFDCIIAPPSAPPQMAAGTYRIGTIIWDMSAWIPGIQSVSAYINPLFDGVIAVINGNIVDVSDSVVLGSHILFVIPEPGTASLLGLGLVALILAGRRSRTPRRIE